MDLHHLIFLFVGVQLLGSVEPQGTDCSGVHCARPPNCDPGFAPIIPLGACCPICLPAVTPGPPIATGPFGCEGVECPDTNCPTNAIPLAPIGHCCPVCQPAPNYTPPTFTSTTSRSTPQASTHTTRPTAATDAPTQQTNTTDSGPCQAIPIAGMVYSDCASVCPRSCASPFTDSCNVCKPGCQCPEGQVIDVRGRKCVPINECPGQNIECPVAGQTLHLCPPCPAQTCQQIARRDMPRVSCPATCRPGCACLPGHVIDEASNRCVLQRDCPGVPTTQPPPTTSESTTTITQGTEVTTPTTVTAEVTTGTSEPLTCPPVCSGQFCSGRRGGTRLCTVPGSGSCGGQCHLTYCRACYHSPVVRTLPANINCGNCNSYSTGNQCFNNWSRCVRRTDRLLNGIIRVRGKDRIPANFRCYAPPCLA